MIHKASFNLSKQLGEVTVDFTFVKTPGLTITNDNGKEFAMHKRVSDELGTDVYFADPYNTNQRALVENANKLVREFLPKNKPFHDVSTAHVMEIERKLNNRPRKCLGFKLEF